MFLAAAIQMTSGPDRAANEARERQQQLESRQFQAQLQATLVADNQAGGLIVVDPPFRPMRPASGERMKVATAGAAGSLVLSLLAAFAAAMFDRRIYDRRDISRIVGPDVIVVVAKLTAARKSA